MISIFLDPFSHCHGSCQKSEVTSLAISYSSVGSDDSFIMKSLPLLPNLILSCICITEMLLKAQFYGLHRMQCSVITSI